MEINNTNKYDSIIQQNQVNKSDNEIKDYEIVNKNIQEMDSVDSEDEEILISIDEKSEDLTEDLTEALETCSSEKEIIESDEDIISISEIIDMWKNQYNAQRYESGTSAEFSDLVNPYITQNQMQVLSFEDLCKIGEYYSAKQELVSTPISQTTKTCETTQTSSTQETKKVSTSDASLLSGENVVGSAEYLAKNLKLAFSDSNLDEVLIYYDKLYDDQGRIVKLTKNSLYDNMNLPDFNIEYNNVEDESISHSISVSSKDNEGNDYAVNIFKYKNSDVFDTNISIVDSLGNTEVKIYDKNGDIVDTVETLGAGKSYTYKGIKVTNTSNKSIQVLFSNTNGELFITQMDDSDTISISCVSSTDAISTDKVFIHSNNEFINYKDYKGTISSSTSTTNNNNSLTANSSTNNSSNISNALKTLSLIANLSSLNKTN